MLGVVTHVGSGSALFPLKFKLTLTAPHSSLYSPWVSITQLITKSILDTAISMGGMEECQLHVCEWSGIANALDRKGGETVAPPVVAFVISLTLNID